jgi:hypothetical protein
VRMVTVRMVGVVLLASELKGCGSAHFTALPPTYLGTSNHYTYTSTIFHPIYGRHI